MKGQSVLHSSVTDNWLTPLELWEKLDAKWQFTLDPCGCAENPLPGMSNRTIFCTSGLDIPWSRNRVFVNPPYSNISEFAAKAYISRDTCNIVMLIPSRTDTRYWHDYIENKAMKVEFLPGRLKFRRPDGGKTTSAPFPSCLVYF